MSYRRAYYGLTALAQGSSESAQFIARLRRFCRPCGRKAQCDPAIALVKQLRCSCKHQKRPPSFAWEVSAGVNLSAGLGSEWSVPEAKNPTAVPLMLS